MRLHAGHPQPATSSCAAPPHTSAAQVLESSLEARVLQSDNSALARDCRKEMKALNGRLLKLGAWPRGSLFTLALSLSCSSAWSRVGPPGTPASQRARPARRPAPLTHAVNRKDRDERRSVRGELRLLAKEERKRQEKAVQEVLRGAQASGERGWSRSWAGRGSRGARAHLAGRQAHGWHSARTPCPCSRQVICTTLTGVGQRNLDRLQFDVVVIDEAAQVRRPHEAASSTCP